MIVEVGGFTGCRNTFDGILLSIHKWVHLCLLVRYNKLQLYYNYELISDTYCINKPGFDYIYESYEYDVVVGGIDQEISLISMPISAKFAGVQIYKKFFSEDQMRLVAQFEYQDGIIEFNKSDVSNGVLRTFEFTSNILFESPTNVTLLFFDVKASYARAEKTCISHGGQLPKDMNIEFITILVSYALKTRITSVSSAWLLNEHKQSHEMCDAMKESDRRFFKVQYKCDDLAAYVVCILEKSVTVRLIGLNSQTFQFYPVPYGGLTFESYNGYRLSMNEKNTELRIENILTKVQIANTVVSKMDIMGLHKWHTDSIDASITYATLTVCKEGEFTCIDGTCIPIEKVCNLIADCIPDGYDEKVCNVAIPNTDFYEKNLAPMQDANTKAKIRFHLELERVIDIKIDESMVDLALKLQVFWRDERLKFKFLFSEIPTFVQEKDYKTYWHPQIYINEGGSSHKEIFFLDNSPGQVYAQQKSKGVLTTYTYYEGRVYLNF